MSIQSFALYVIRHRLTVFSKSNYATPVPNASPQFGELGWAHEVENGTNRNVNPTFLCDFHARFTYIIGYLAPFSHNSQRGRQTNNSSIGGLMMRKQSARNAADVRREKAGSLIENVCLGVKCGAGSAY